MKSGMTLGIVGSGPSAIFLLKHLLDVAALLKTRVGMIEIFEKGQLTGMGMPYNPLTTDRYNLGNIASEELPALPETMVEWLGKLDAADLIAMGLEGEEISASKIYPRLVLGQYLHAQYQALIRALEDAGIRVREHPSCEVSDIFESAGDGQVELCTADGKTHRADKVVIATGHLWRGEDCPEKGYFASPWPIRKLLPEDGTYHDFSIGMLGASLSAFDVVTSLAHRHGRFKREGGRLTFEANGDAQKFRLAMHSMNGWLPHLQWAQEEPLRDIYRHASRDEILGLRDREGFLRLETYFDKVCRRVLCDAFRKDRMPEMVAKLSDGDFKLADFVEAMSRRHEYENAFEGMREEMKEARRSVEREEPIHWKEVLDDLIYALNFHAELMPAEDHLEFHKTVMPFLMNVIAAMPLESAEILLALHEAGRIEIIAGRAEWDEEGSGDGRCRVRVRDDREGEASHDYGMFVDCGGQRPVEVDEYPFRGLVEQKAVKAAKVRFAAEPPASVSEDAKDRIVREGEAWYYRLPGIQIDAVYRLHGEGGSNGRVGDLAFSHCAGLRPYSYGLQCCSDTAAIFVKALTEEFQGDGMVEGDAVELSRFQEQI